MMTKFIFIIICSLYVLQVNAQQLPALNNFITRIDRSVTIVRNDTSLNIVCKKNIELFPAKFRRLTLVDLTDTYLNELKQNAIRLGTVPKDSGFTCNSASMRNMVKVVNDFISEINKTLKTVKKTTPPAAVQAKKNIGKPVVPVKIPTREEAIQPVHLSFKLIDSVTGKSISGNMNVDSLGAAVSTVTNGDSTNFDVLVYPGGNYTINVSAKNYIDYTNDVIIPDKPLAQLIQLQKKPPVKRSADTSATTTVLQRDSMPPTVTPNIAAPESTSTGWIVAVLISAGIALVAVVGYFRTHRRLEELVVKNRDITRQPFEQIIKPGSMDKNPEPVNPEPLLATDPPVETPPESVPVPEPIEAPVIDDKPVTNQNSVGEPAVLELALEPIANPVEPVKTFAAGAYFVCELMMTAGPRKKYSEEENNDRDIGEDICGFVSNTQHIFLWLLDGTSDNHVLKNPADEQEYFSSRLLALSIADKLKKSFVESPTTVLSEIILPAIAEVRINWLQHIESLPDSEKEHLQQMVAKKRWPDCSTTLLFASLSLAGDFNCYRTGDSKMYLYDGALENDTPFIDTAMAVKNDEINDRLFFRLVIDEDGKFDIKHNTPRYETIEHKKIRSIIAFSDGIGAVTEQTLREGYSKRSNGILRDIMYQSQATGDDKTICFIEIKELQST